MLTLTMFIAGPLLALLALAAILVRRKLKTRRGR